MDGHHRLSPRELRPRDPTTRCRLSPPSARHRPFVRWIAHCNSHKRHIWMSLSMKYVHTYVRMHILHIHSAYEDVNLRKGLLEYRLPHTHTHTYILYMLPPTPFIHTYIHTLTSVLLSYMLPFSAKAVMMLSLQAGGMKLYLCEPLSANIFLKDL